MSDVLMYVCPMKRPGGTPKNCGACRTMRSDMSGECDCCGMQLVLFVPEKEPQTVTVSGSLPAALKAEECARCGYQKWKFWGKTADGAEVWGQCECEVAARIHKVAEFAPTTACEHRHTETVADAVVVRCAGCGHEEIRKQTSVKT